MLTGQKDYSCGIIGCIGKDDYGDMLLKELAKVNVQTFLEITEKDLTSRCGCGIYKKERCLMPEIRASNKLSSDYINKNLSKSYIEFNSYIDTKINKNIYLIHQ